jgi:hypothetical protein
MRKGAVRCESWCGNALTTIRVEEANSSGFSVGFFGPWTLTEIMVPRKPKGLVTDESAVIERHGDSILV